MASERVGVYPGTFDPITSGHMEVVRRSLRLVDKLIIGPATNIGKGPLFSLQERIDIINDDIEGFLPTDRARIHIAPFLVTLAVLFGLMMFAFLHPTLRRAGEQPASEEDATVSILERSEEG